MLTTIKIHPYNVQEIIIDELVLAMDMKFSQRSIRIVIRQIYNYVKCSWNVLKTLRRGVRVDMKLGILDGPSKQQI